MDLKTTIKQQAQKLFKTEAAFCAEQGYTRTDFPKKKQTMQNQYDYLTEFLAPLGLEVIIKEK